MWSASHGADRRIRRAAHALGWGGHFLTESRRYSVTFTTLRRARLEHRKRQGITGQHEDAKRRIEAATMPPEGDRQ